VKILKTRKVKIKKQGGKTNKTNQKK